jgi:outer membrane protein assembly factor BamC
MSNRLLIRSSHSVNPMSVVLLLSVFVWTISGCSLTDDDGMFRNRSKDYLLTVESPKLQVPEGLDSGAVGELYRVPEIPETTVLEEVEGTPRPQLLSTNVLEEEVKVQNLSGRRWILINRLPSEVWPRVRNLLNRNAVPVAFADAPRGVIETVWLEFEDDSERNHRYRFSIEQGVQPKSTEISILHMSMLKDTKVLDWPLISVDEEREKTMLNVLASALAGDPSSGTVSMLAQEIGGDAKVVLLAPKDEFPYLLVRLDFDRTWASVGYAVTKDNFKIVDQDRSAGVLYINYDVGKDDQPGFFSRILGIKAVDEIPEINYRVTLTSGSEGVEIRVYGDEQEALGRVETLRLLKKIRANLS